MKYSCDIIRDLLPLYIDDVASSSSRRMVEEHLAECAECQQVLSRLQSSEAESAVTAERDSVIAGQRRFFARRSAVAGSVIAAIFMIPIIVCLIVNLASGKGLDWFFIVLCSLLVAASLSIVPLMAPQNKGLWTLGSFTVSLLLLLGVCCLYTGGKWFFIAAFAVLFGLSLILSPFVVISKPVSGILKDRKGIAVMTADTVLYLAMMLAIGLRTKSPNFFLIAGAISVPVLLFAWILSLIIRNTQKVRTRQEYLNRLEEEMTGLPKEQTEMQLACSKAQIEKKMGAGLSEQEAVSQMEPIDLVVSRIRESRKMGSDGKNETKRRMQAWEIVLLILGSPLWIPLLLAGFAILLSVFIVLWVLIIALWAVMAACIAGAIAGIVLGIWSFAQGNGLQGVVLLSAGTVFAGLSILLFFSAKAATKGAALLTGNIPTWIKTLFQKKENTK